MPLYGLLRFARNDAEIRSTFHGLRRLPPIQLDTVGDYPAATFGAGETLTASLP
jgi:hypothetical protein